MSRTARDRESARLHLSVPAEVKDRLERVQETLGAESLSAVVCRGVEVLEWVIRERSAGRRIVSVGSGIEREVVILFGDLSGERNERE